MKKYNYDYIRVSVTPAERKEILRQSFVTHASISSIIHDMAFNRPEDNASAIACAESLSTLSNTLGTLLREFNGSNFIYYDMLIQVRDELHNMEYVISKMLSKEDGT